jgi:hypothetical protein
MGPIRWLVLTAITSLLCAGAGCTPSSAVEYEQHLSITIAPIDQASTGLAVASAER